MSSSRPLVWFIVLLLPTITEMVKGKNLEDVGKIKNTDIAKGN